MIVRQSIEASDSSPQRLDALDHQGRAAPQMDEPAWLHASVDTRVGRADQAVVTMVGEVDIASAGALGLRLSALVDQGFVRIVVDLSGVEFCDVYGFGLLARASRRTAQSGGWLRLAGARPRVARVIGIVRLARTLHTYRTVSDALEGREASRTLAGLDGAGEAGQAAEGGR